MKLVLRIVKPSWSVLCRDWCVVVYAHTREREMRSERERMGSDREREVRKRKEREVWIKREREERSRGGKQYFDSLGNFQVAAMETMAKLALLKLTLFCFSLCLLFITWFYIFTFPVHKGLLRFPPFCSCYSAISALQLETLHFILIYTATMTVLV